MPIAFIPSSTAKQIDNIPIVNIYAIAFAPSGITASSAPGLAGKPQTNHWVLHIEVAEGKSFCLDPTPGGTEMSMVLIVTQKEPAFLTSAIKRLRLTSSKDLTVGELFKYITDAGYDNCQFSTTGQGCRFWIQCTLSLLLAKKALLNASEVQEATKAIEAVWDETGKRALESEQTGVVRGKFER